MLNKLRIQAEDALRYNPGVRSALASYTLWKVARAAGGGTSGRSGDAARAIDRLCQAARLAPSAGLMQRAEAAIAKQMSAVVPAEIPWADVVPEAGATRIPKAVVLKRYVSEREKGVVFVSFDNQMARLANANNLKQFAERYTLVLSPQWSPPHSAAAYLFPLVYPGPIVCLISNERDLEYFPRISGQYKMVPLYASSWVDPRKYTPVPLAEKNIDIFMLANFAKYKRHHALFAALADVPSDYRVVLVGQRERGRTRETILNEAGLFGVRDRFEIRENVSEEELHDTFVRAKTSVILSRREGSCVAVVESMFANTPVGLYKDAEIGSRAFVNEQTGCLFEHASLGAQLQRFVERSAGYEPRRWVMEHGIGCVASSQVLNDALKRFALEAGAAWTEDIATLRWRPDPQYYDPEEYARLKPSYEEIERVFGITIGNG